jgi:voltage-gated potassium channel
MARWTAKTRRRRLKASWRDTLLLFREFKNPLLVFIVVMTSGGFLYYWLSQNSARPAGGLVEAIYLVLSLSFLQSGGDFPYLWYLQIFYFIMPVLGIGILAQGLADFGVFFFNRRARGKEWEMAVASTYSNHTVLIGLGHLGYRVVKKLYDLGQDVVVVELNPRADLLANIRKLDIPVLQADGTHEMVLEAAGVRRARAILLCTQNDSLNLQMAVKARTLNPQIQVIVRIFDDDFATALHQQFGFQALSATGLAAPIFAASAANVDITSPITIGGVPNSLARLEIASTSKLVGRTVEDLENQYHISIVLVVHDHQKTHHPAGSIIIFAQDILVFLAEPDRVHQLVHDNQ